MKLQNCNWESSRIASCWKFWLVSLVERVFFYLHIIQELWDVFVLLPNNVSQLLLFLCAEFRGFCPLCCAVLFTAFILQCHQLSLQFHLFPFQLSHLSGNLQWVSMFMSFSTTVWLNSYHENYISRMRTDDCFHYWANYLVDVKQVMVRMVSLNSYDPRTGDFRLPGTMRLVTGF